MLTVFLYFGLVKHQSMRTKIKEIWKDVVGYETNYQVSNLGSVISKQRLVKNRYGNRIVRARKLAQCCRNTGYYYVVMCFDGVCRPASVHRLVASAFIPNPDNKRQVNHKNSIKTDNNVENLEWATPSENRIHAIRSGKDGGLFKVGHKHHYRKS